MRSRAFLIVCFSILTFNSYAQNNDSLRTSLLGYWQLWGVGRITEDSLVCGENCRNWSITFKADSTFSSLVIISDNGQHAIQTGKYRIITETKTIFFYDITIIINDVASKLNDYERRIKRMDSNSMWLDKCLVGAVNIEVSEIKSCTPQYKKR